MESTRPESLEDLSRRIADLFIGLKMITFLFLIVASIGNIYAALTIDYFQRLFSDALPGKPLPDLTEIVIAHKSLLFYLALLFPMVGGFGLIIRRNIKLATGLMASALMLTLLESGAVMLALRLPMVSLIQGMTDSH